MANYFNITSDLTQELLAAGSNENVSSISFTNVGTLTCTVDLYIEKNFTGKFYFLKGVKIPVGTTLVYENPKFSNNTGEFGLYIKLNASDSAVDVIIK